VPVWPNNSFKPTAGVGQLKLISQPSRAGGGLILVLGTMKLITASDIQHVLNQWAQGELSESEVHAWAEDRFCTSAYECESEEANEVLGRLDMMDMNLVTSEDIPVLMKALFSPDFESILATHDEQIDFAERRVALRHVPLYSRFCA
jgi:hypothetical protein